MNSTIFAAMKFTDLGINDQILKAIEDELLEKPKELNPTLWQGQNQMGKLLMKLGKYVNPRHTFIPT